jgi:diguanylate cyclase (GGDEF)-like protein/PAS domain S-box-containing protein
MYEQKLEQGYKDKASRVVFFCVIAFCIFRTGFEMLYGEFKSGVIMAGVSCVFVLAFSLMQKRNFKIFSFLIPFLIYLFYVATSFAIDSFKYFYDVYILILAISATYFNIKNYLVLAVVTQVINAFLSIFVLPEHATGSVLVHFILILGISVVIFTVVQFAVDKIDSVKDAFVFFGELMKVSPSSLILLDDNNRIKYMSRSVGKNLGVKDAENCIGKNFLDLFSDNSVVEMFDEIVKKRSYYGDYHKIIVNGQLKTFDVFADKISEGKEAGMLFMLNDVTEIMRLKELAEQDSLMDGLVQIPNRRAFDKQIVSEWNHAAREKVNLSFLMIDIDFFKRYNDTYGHRQGDELLKAAGQIFKKNLKRSIDFVARIGGEEFGILLYGTNSYQANAVAEKIRKSVESEVILTPSGAQTNFTVSIGVSSIIPHASLEYDFIIEEADKALYKAKQNGRNHVWVADW